MREIQLPRTGLDDLKFRGELVAAASGRQESGLQPDRWHEIAVYRTDRNTWVVAISYRTSFPGESGNDYVEEVNDVDDVEPLLSLYNPEEYFRPADSDPSRATAMANAVRELVRRYDSVVCQVLDKLPQAAPTTASQPPTSVSETSLPGGAG